MITTTTPSAPAGVQFPDNVSLSYGSSHLAGLALQIASGEGDDGNEPWLADRSTFLTKARMLATMITCYASGVFGSDEVQWAAEANPAVRLIARDCYLGSEIVTRFRRSYRGRIENALSRLLSAVSVGSHSDEDVRAAALLEARRRVNLAILFDAA